MRRLFLIFWLIAANCVVAEKRYDGHQVLQFVPNSWNQVDSLNSLQNVMFWKRPSKPGEPVDIMLHKMAATKLMEKLGSSMKGKIMIPDVQKLIDIEKAELNLASRLSNVGENKYFALNQYHTLNDIYSWMDSLTSLYPTVVRTSVIGKSYEGRDLKIIKIGRPKPLTNGSKPGMWIDAGIHAREWVAPATALFIINELVTNYSSNPVYKQLMDSMDFYIMPSANPDGYAYSHSNDRLWRKTRKPYKKNGWFGPKTCYGADPNRNFDFHWMDSGTSSDPCDETYGGPTPFSEPECKQMSQWLFANKEILQSYISLHSYSDLWMYGYGYARKTYPSDVAELRALSITAAEAIRAVNGVEYDIGSPTDILYAASGASDDWAKGVASIKWTYTLELRPGPTDPDRDQAYGFQLPAKYIIPTATEAWAGILKVAQKVMTT